MGGLTSRRADVVTIEKYRKPQHMESDGDILLIL